MLNLIQCGLERSTRFGLENFAHEVRIKGDLYVRSDTLLLADIFENFRQSCFKIYELDPAHFVSLPGLAWQACLENCY